MPDAQEGQPSLETIPDAGEQGAAEIIQEAEEHTQPEDLAQEQSRAASCCRNQPGLTQPESASGIAVFYFCAFAALLTVACLVVVRWKKGRAKGVKLTTIVLLLAAVVTVTAGSVYAFAGKGDLNRDGAVDYNDVHRLQRHLIALQALPDGTWDAADMNFDGRLTVTDLSLLVQKIEQTLDYDVNITPAMDKFYYEKQEDVLLKFSAAVSYGAQIECVTVNGREYAVQKTQDGEYTVELQAADTPGLQIFHLTKVRLSNDRDVKVNVTETIDVLKAAPSVEDFLAEEWTETAQMKVSFHLNDEDAALISSALEVLKNTDGEFTMVDTMEISAGDNAFVLDLEEDMAYTLHISAQYNRDSDALPAEEDHRGSLAVMKEIQLNIDYQFSFGGLRTQTQGGFVTDKFHKNQRIDLWFESGNATRFLPERAVVNGVSYPVGAVARRIPGGPGWVCADRTGRDQSGADRFGKRKSVPGRQTENAIAVMIRERASGGRRPRRCGRCAKRTIGCVLSVDRPRRRAVEPENSNFECTGADGRRADVG